MNKYQRAILENQDTKVFYACSSIKKHSTVNTDFDYDADTCKLIQEEDIFSTQYEFTVKANSNIESCEFYINDEWHAVERKEGKFLLVLDFNSRTEKIKLSFADTIADDYIFSVQYIEADKDLYYQKQAEVQRKTYIEAAQIKHSTGADLVNIYFQPCCSDYGKTEIELWLAKGKFEEFHGSCATFWNPRLLGGTPEQMIAKFSLEDGFYFKAITGLAKGVYAYKLRQYSKNNELLFESDFQFFNIRPQGAGTPQGQINVI